MPDDRDELDRLLDSALATYADSGADSGLEQRILNNIALNAAPAPRRRWLPWTIALPAAAMLLLFILLSGPRPFHAPSSSPPQAHITSPPSASSNQQSAENPGKGLNQRSDRQSAGNRAKALYQGRTSVVPNKPSNKPWALAPARSPRPPRAILAANSSPLPKLEIFPTPRPLTSQERALAVYLAHMPLAEQQAFARPQQEPVPLTLASIDELPLGTPDLTLLSSPIEGEN